MLRTVPSGSLMLTPLLGDSSITVPRRRPPFFSRTVSSLSPAQATAGASRSMAANASPAALLVEAPRLKSFAISLSSLKATSRFPTGPDRLFVSRRIIGRRQGQPREHCAKALAAGATEGYWAPHASMHVMS
jgi:hypothetical protein